MSTINDLELKKSQLAELVQLAKADGHVDAHEVILIKNLALHLGLQNEDFQKVVSNPEMVMFRKSYDDLENRQRFYRALMMMQMDLKAHPEEKAFCQELGQRLGLDSSNVSKALAALEENGGEMTFDSFNELMG